MRQKNNKDRECQAITEIYLILLSLRQKNFPKDKENLYHIRALEVYFRRNAFRR